MKMKRYAVVMLMCGGILATSCSSETSRDQLYEADYSKATYAQVRGEIKSGAETLKGDIQQRLDVLQPFINDMMEKYRTADQDRREELQPDVEKLRTLINEVRGTLKTYQSDQEKLSQEQQKQIINTMQELRKTYQDLVTRLGITWH